jgi:hypothetical protein
MPDKLSIKAGSLENPDLGGEIDYELYTKRRVAYLKPVGGVKQLEGVLMPWLWFPKPLFAERTGWHW